MNYRIISLVIFNFIAGAAVAQTEVTDSVRKQALGEVVVEASNQRTSSNVSTYIPMARQKKRGERCDLASEPDGDSSDRG